MKCTIFQKMALAELKRRKWSRYSLVQQLEGKVSAVMIYKWLAGTKRMGEDNLELVFKALNLKICRK